MDRVRGKFKQIVIKTNVSGTSVQCPPYPEEIMWNATQVPPLKQKGINRHRSKLARASRKRNR
jgi:hypothetical protein